MRALKNRYLTRSYRLPLLLIVVFCPLLLFSGELNSGGRLSLIYSGNRRSELEPCGCQNKQLGGIDREAYLLAHALTSPTLQLRVDSGGFTDRFLTENERLKTEFLLRAMAKLDYQAINVGIDDIAVGLGYLQEQEKKLGLAFVSCNIVEEKTGKPVFPAYRIVEIPSGADGAALKVGITGVTLPADKITQPFPEGDRPRIAPTSNSRLSNEAPVAQPAVSNVQTNAQTPEAAVQHSQPRNEFRVSTIAPADKGIYVRQGLLDDRRFPDTSPTQIIQHIEQWKRDHPTSQTMRASSETSRPVTTVPMPGMDPDHLPPWLIAPARRPQTESPYSAPSGQPGASRQVLPQQPAPVGEPRSENLTRGQSHPVPGGGVTPGKDVGTGKGMMVSPHDFMGTIITPPEEALRAVIAELRPKCEIIVVLAYMPVPWARKLAQEAPGAQVIISGTLGTIVSSPQTVNGALLVHPGYDGRHLGDLELQITPGQTPQVIKADLVEVLSNGKTVDALTQFIEDYKKETAHLTVAKQTSAPKAIYAGAESCKLCHAGSYNQWKSTKHSLAMQTLISKNQQFNPDCLKCHTTGYKHENGFNDWRITEHMASVQCEICHGPSRDHVLNERRLKLYAGQDENQRQLLTKLAAESRPMRLPEASVCMQCHTEQTDSNFDYTKKLPLISHHEAAGGSEVSGKM
ncbi:MAG: multiheme c-type cytochrome [bacterium]